jgi:hypothetical protein
MNESTSTFLALGFSLSSLAAVITALTFTSNYGTPQENYRKSFDKTMECREKIKTPTNIDVVCGKIPQWSEFMRESK